MVEIKKCEIWDFKNVTSNHFTVCQKPWYCYNPKNNLCQQFTDHWWQRLNKLQTIFNLSPHTKQCPNHQYIPINYSQIL